RTLAQQRQIAPRRQNFRRRRLIHLKHVRVQHVHFQNVGSRSSRRLFTADNSCRDFYYRICLGNGDCRKGYVCALQKRCIPSRCQCTKRTGRLRCSSDCQRGVGLCKKTRP
ncbi:MAG: hypothetical protein AAGJ35_00400, partial [Myxococcota bacterium]